MLDFLECIQNIKDPTLGHASGFPEFAAHAGHILRMLKMFGKELLDGRTKCSTREKV